MYNRLKNMSYIYARDPNVVFSYNKPKVRKNLISQYDPPDVSEEYDNNSYNVYLRIKSSENLSDLYEIKGNTLFSHLPNEATQSSSASEDSNTKTFKFSKIIDPDCRQAELFDDIVKRKVLSFINGHDCSLMTYGASGSGKTFTIVGTAEQPGIIPRSLEYLFRTLPTLSKMPAIMPNATGGISYMTESDCKQDNMDRQFLLSKYDDSMNRTLHIETYKQMQKRLSSEPVGLIEDVLNDDVILSVWVSFAEIYNENVYDLLKSEPTKRQLRKKLHLGNINGNSYIKGLSTVSVSSGLEAYLILQFGLHNLKYAATSVNNHSSRSHCLFTLKIAQASRVNKETYVSVFNFCDLAGSERIKKTHNVGDRLKESNSINTFFSVLGRCVKLLRDNNKFKNNKLIPFRESKLTQIFKNALLGNEALSMIVSINSSREMFDETQHVLNFTAIAKDVIVKQQTLKSCKNTQFSNLNASIEENFLSRSELQEQISQLTLELQQQRLNNDEDREHVILTYKKILDDVTKNWEKRYRDLGLLLEGIISENSAREHKKAKLSVIVINSSEEDSDEENALNIEEERVRREIAHYKEKLNLQQEEMLKAKEDSLLLESALTAEQVKCAELKLEKNTTINFLKSKSISNNERIRELNLYIDRITEKNEANSLDVFDKESSCI